MSYGEPLVDSLGRVHTNLRISVTDRCNIRCFYCMPIENVQFKPRHELLSFEEIERFVRVVAPLGVARLNAPVGPPGSPPPTHVQLELCLVSDGTPIHSIALSDMAAPESTTLTLGPANAQAAFVAVNTGNQPAGAAQPASWPLQFKGLGRLSLQFDRGAAALSPLTTLLQLKNAEGRIIGEARFNE